MWQIWALARPIEGALGNQTQTERRTNATPSKSPALLFIRESSRFVVNAVKSGLLFHLVDSNLSTIRKRQGHAARSGVQCADPTCGAIACDNHHCQWHVHQMQTNLALPASWLMPVPHWASSSFASFALLLRSSEATWRAAAPKHIAMSWLPAVPSSAFQPGLLRSWRVWTDLISISVDTWLPSRFRQLICLGFSSFSTVFLGLS